MSDKPRNHTTTTVLQAVQDLYDAEQPATRETIASMTGLRLTIVDDRLGALYEDGKIRRVLRGHYVPAVTHPPARPISKTILDDGRVKIEIGDQLLTLTPRESRRLAELHVGSTTAAQVAEIEGSRAMQMVACELGEHIKAMERKLAMLEKRS